MIIEFHIGLPNLPAVLDSLDSFREAVGGDCAGGDGGFGYEEDGCLRHEGREHGSADYWLYGGD